MTQPRDELASSIPTAFICPIDGKKMRDPVTLPSGWSCDKASLLQAIKNKQWDIIDHLFEAKDMNKLKEKGVDALSFLNGRSDKKPEDGTVCLIENRRLKQLLEMKSSILRDKEFYTKGEEGVLDAYLSDTISLEPFKEVPVLISSGMHYAKEEKNRLLEQGKDDVGAPVFLAYPDENLFLLKQELEYGMGITADKPAIPKNMPKPPEFEIEFFASVAMDNITKQITAIHEAAEKVKANVQDKSARAELKKALILTAEDLKKFQANLNEIDEDKSMKDVKVDILATLHNELKQAEQILQKDSKKNYSSTMKIGLAALKEAASSQNLKTIGPELERMTTFAKEISRQTIGILDEIAKKYSPSQLRNVITQLANAKDGMKCGFFESKDAFKVRQESMNTIIEKVRLVLQERELLQDEKHKNDGGGVGRTLR